MRAPFCSPSQLVAFMKMKLVFAALFSLLISATWAEAAETNFIRLGKYDVHPSRLIVKPKSGYSQPAQTAAVDALGLKARAAFRRIPRLVVLEERVINAQASPQARAQTLAARIAALRASGQFEYVQPDYVLRPTLQPNDTRFQDGTLWGLKNNGGQGGVVGADIDAEGAWDITTGDTNVIVAVIDTGVRYTHQDLAAQMWRNPGEIPGNGIDDDGNGYVDDIFGINAPGNNGDPMDFYDHGTHVAGTIGAAANNGSPHVGVAWKVRIMALKFLNPFGFTADAIECLDYAVAKGAKISNNSWGGGPFNQGLLDAIIAARDAGHLFIAAAGNDGTDNDSIPHYPSNYEVDNVISVAALDRADRLASFSDYGLTTVHLGAPGVAIFSSTAGSDSEYQFFNGTSMATPHVTGVAALLAAKYPQATYSELRDAILQTVVPIPALAGKCTTGGRLNAYQALAADPDGFLELAVSPVSGDVVLSPSVQPIIVRVSDRFGITNATVTALVTNNGLFYTNLVFLNTGAPPDLLSNDALYSANLSIPAGSTSLVMTVSATAPDKIAADLFVSYNVVTLPTNDDFESPKKIAAAGGLILSTTKFATLQAGEPIHAGVATVDHSLWWTWLPSTSGQALLDPAGSSFDTVLAVYTGTNLTSLVPVASVDDVGSSAQGHLFFNATAGVTYRIVVAGSQNGEVGALRLRVQVGGLPDTNAPVVNISSPSNGQILTTNFITLVGTSFDPAPNASGVAEVSVILNGSPAGVVAFGTTNWTSPILLSEGPNTIQVVARDFSGNLSAPRVITVAYNPQAPVNDHFVNASPLSLATNVVTAITTAATGEFGEPNHAFGGGGKSAWWLFTPPTDGLLVLGTTNSSFDTLLGLYLGSAVNALTTVAANDDAYDGSFFSSISQAVRAGQTYRIAVDGYAGAGGNVALDYAFSPGAVYDLNLAQVGHGLTVPATGVYPYASNELVTLSAIPGTNFVFAGWTGSFSSTANPLSFNITNQTSLVAQFIPRLLSDDFELGFFNTNRVSWNPVGPLGNIPWVIQSNHVATGNFAAKSGDIGNNQASRLALTVNVVAGNGVFNLRVSSEQNWDFLEFYVDGIRRDRWSGELGWVSYQFPLAAGTRVLEWRYVKDSDGVAGLDAAFIDDLDLPVVPPSIQLTQPGVGTFTVQVTGQANQLYFLESSTNITVWQRILTNHWSGTPFQFTDPTASASQQKYYRGVISP